MIEDRFRYFAPGGALTPGGPSRWHILDWDQRRIIAVTMDEEQESEDVAVEHLKKHIDNIGPDVYAVHLSQDGELTSVSTDPRDDQATCVYYPPLRDVQLPEGAKTVLRSDLTELDRLGANADLISYVVGKNTRRVVFKYYFLVQFLERIWFDMNVWMRLPPHPNLVPFDCLVLDELHGHVVGFTSLYIPGGTLSENKSRTFKLEWLRQLTSVIDDLNLKYGIVHQDVAARNLLVHPETEALMLFDFNYGAQIGTPAQGEHRDDVKGVIFTLYEIITGDMHFRQVPHDQQNPADVQGMENWVQHPEVKLDHPISEYRSVLNEWERRRREGKQIAIYTDASEYIECQDFPKPAPTDQVFKDSKGNKVTVPWVITTTMRWMEREKGNSRINWERPLQAALGNGKRLLATGQFST